MTQSDSVISLSGLERQDYPDDGVGNLDGPTVKPFFQRASYPPRVSLNALLITLLCTVLLVFIGFVPVSIPSPLELPRLFQGGTKVGDLALMRYTFLAPMALMVGAFLGPYLGVFSVLLFLAIGIFAFPVFANGGGWQYVFQPGFGYLLGMLAAAWLLGRNFHRAFSRDARVSRSSKLFALALGAVMLMHGFGIAHMLLLSLTGQLPWQDLPGWALRLSVETAPWDVSATFVLLCLVRQLRLMLWLILY